MEILQFIAENLPLTVCFITGIGLLIAEAIMPGFGVPGISGIILEIVALVLTWMQHGPLATLGMLLIVLSVLAIAVSTSLRSMTKGKLSKSSLINNHVESNENGYRSTEDLEVFLGREGLAITPLRPTGMAEFEDVKLNVVSEGEFIPQGTPVRIVKVEGAKILVRRVKA